MDKVLYIIGKKIMNKKSNQRIKYLDIARAIAVLWIVGYWHLRVYCGKDFTHPVLSFPGDAYITNVVLGLFMFISGFFISKYTFLNYKQDTIAFYKKRLKRFYILYAISAILLFLLNYNSIFGRRCLITTLTATSTYILPQPRTLWFFSMLASFYFITPYLMRKQAKSMWIKATVIYIGAYFITNLLSKGIDLRFFWCFPLYILGLFIGRRMYIMTFLLSHKFGLVAFILFFIHYTIILTCPNKLSWLQYATLPFSIIFFIYLSRLLTYLPMDTLASKIAYCSMCAYLFHREIYIILMLGYDALELNFSYWFSAIVFLPLCLILSYFIQQTYDKIILKFEKKL